MENTSKIAIIEGVTLLFILGFVLPALISAKSTTLVILGVGVIVGLLCVVFDVTPYKSKIIELIKKDML